MKNKEEKIVNWAKEVIDIEKDALASLEKRIDKEFIKAVKLIFYSKGYVIVTGMGKAGIIGQKFSATLASFGISSFWLHKKGRYCYSIHF